MDLSLLLTYWQLKDKPFKTPYTYQLGKNGRYVFYFGANHSHNPNDAQYPLLEKQWREFLQKTKDGKRIVLIEGSLPSAVKNKKEAIKQWAEAGYLYALARKQHIPVVSPEPSLSAQANRLLKKYSRDEIEYYFFAGVVLQWLELPKPRLDFKKYVQKFLAKDKRQLKWKNYDFSIKHMEAIHAKLFKKPINYNDTSFFNELMNPYKKGVINRIKVETAKIRDRYILGCVEREWKKSKNIFIAFGSSHAVIQERVIRNLIGH